MTLLRPFHVNACAAQLLEMPRSMLGGDDMVRAFTALEAVAHERQESRVLFLGGTEKRADMSVLTEHGAGERDGCRTRRHSCTPPPVVLTMDGTRAQSRNPWPRTLGSYPSTGLHTAQHAPVCQPWSIILWCRRPRAPGSREARYA